MAKTKPVGSVTKAKLLAKTRKSKPADTVYQFKITLEESHLPIWRGFATQLQFLEFLGSKGRL